MKRIKLCLLLLVAFSILGCSKDEPAPTINEPDPEPASPIPSKPKNLTVQYEDSIVVLRWQTPDSLGTPIMTRYLVYRKTGSGTYENIGFTLYNTTSYRDTNTIIFNNYSYYVTALNTEGESQRSNEVNAVPYPFGTNGEVYAIAVNGSEVYVAGDFTVAGGISANRVAKWNGNNWSPLGSGMNERVYSLAVEGNTLYAGGTFTQAGSATTRWIAKWDGSSWTSVGGGVTGGSNGVTAIAIDNNQIYVGGDFTSAGSITCNGLARWNGTNWERIGNGLNSSSKVNSIVIDQNLIIGGSFSVIGSLIVRNIAMWNGSTWQDIGGGISGGGPFGPLPVSSIALNFDNLYVTGRFSSAGSSICNNIAKWDGNDWLSLNNGLNPVSTQTSGFALLFDGSELYVTGKFTEAGSVDAMNIARWNGTSWFSLGSGINGDQSEGRCLAKSGNGILIGGLFTSAGGISAKNVAIWNGSEWRGF